MTRVYLDHAATTPLRPEARSAVEEGFRLWANPSSPHAEGRAARRALEDARERVRQALGWEGEVIFTSGASEALAIALGRAKAGARLVSAVEHDAVLQAAPDAERLPILGNGMLDLEILTEAVRRERPLVAVQSLNSETGVQQPCNAVAEVVHQAGGLLLVDASQSAGKEPLPGGADMVAVSAHKLGGPIGIGALLVRDYALLEPVGGHERGYRRGTENLPGAMGFAAALEAAGSPYLAPEVTAAIGTEIFGRIAEAGGELLSLRLARPSHYVLAIAMPSMSAEAQLMRFDMAGIAVSQGSACSSGTLKRSHVLEAMGVAGDLAARTIRVSPGWNSSAEDIRTFANVWCELAANAQVSAA